MTREQTQALLAWYDENKRKLPWRGSANAYHVWLSEIMCQQTRVEAVKSYYARFLAALPAVENLAEADNDRLLKLWEGLGYYSRVRNLKKAAQIIVRDYAGRVPGSPEELLKLPGIGLYTAGAIASIAFGVPVPAVDGNALRVLARLWGDYTDIALDQTKRAFAARLLRAIPQDRPGVFNQAIMELGALVCLPNGAPLCERCPLQKDCHAHQHNLIAELPVKSAKNPRRIEHRQLLILRCENKLALRRRPLKGLLAGMLELPECFDIPAELVLADEDAGAAVHIFTHIEWHMTACKITLREEIDGEGLVWVTREELEQAVALPSAFAGFRDKMF